jgi:hypothetical protein
MALNSEASFDPSEYSTEKTIVQIRELRDHIANDLIPEACNRIDAQFIKSFVMYLDALALRFEQYVEAPLDILAFVTRNLLEFSLLLPVVFDSEHSKMLFLNEAFRIDTRDLSTRLDAMFIAIGEPSAPGAEEKPDLDWLPESNTRLTGQRGAFDSWFHKFCSKLMHPTAIMIIAENALTDPIKRVTLCFAGLQYMAISYNFLSDQIFPE